MDPYKANNTASRSIEISSVDSDEELMSYYARFGFIAMAVIIFVIVVVLVVKYLFVVQRPPDDSEESEDESKEDSGKRGKEPGRKPPAKIEPPELSRRKWYVDYKSRSSDRSDYIIIIIANCGLTVSIL
jgi:hypothetical protein